MVELICQTKPTARYHHKCEECGQLINPQEQYIRQFCKDYGYCWTYKTHIDCFEASRAYFKFSDYEPFDMWQGLDHETLKCRDARRSILKFLKDHLQYAKVRRRLVLTQLERKNYAKNN